MMRATVLTAFLLCLFAGSSSAQEFLSWDWSTTCNDKNYCIARTDGEGVALKIERPAADESDVFVTVRITQDTPLEEDMRVDIDVLDRGFSDSKSIDRVYRGNEMTFGGSADRPLVEALRLGNRGQVTVKFGGNIGTRVYDISLRGVTSALAEIDRRQGRDDRTDAIVLKGGIAVGEAQQQALAQPAPEPEPQPASAPPPSQPTAEPEILHEPALWSNLFYDESDLPERVLMAGYRTLECDFPYTLEGYGAIAHGVVADLEIWLVPCVPADLNVGYYVAFSSPGEADYYEFAATPNSDVRNAIITNPSWDNERRQLTTYYYSSPDSDCGGYAVYQYVTEDDAFDMIEMREKNDCDGVMTLPENYPLVWAQ